MMSFLGNFQKEHATILRFASPFTLGRFTVARDIFRQYDFPLVAADS